jgi:hypothetical protein
MKNDWKIISERVTELALPILPHIRPKNLKSSILSNLFESQAAEYYNSINVPVRVCESDREPDLTFTDTNSPLEIKVTGLDHPFSNQLKWMGGKYSKRSSDYILIAYHYTPSNNSLWKEELSTIKYFICKTHINEEEWKTLDNGNENYYATVFSSNNLVNKDHEVLVGKRNGVFYCE